MTGLLEVFFDEAFPAPESSYGFSCRRIELFGNLLERVSNFEAATTPAVGSLDGNGHTMLFCEGKDLLGRVHRVRGPGSQGRLNFLGNVSGRNLVTQRADGGGRWTDPDQSCVNHHLRKVCVFR